MSNMIKIPIEHYEEDMDTESAKTKKKEILEFLQNSNDVKNEEYGTINLILHKACRVGDLELIKIILSKTIQDTSNSLKFKIDETNRTASLNFHIEILKYIYICYIYL